MSGVFAFGGHYWVRCELPAGRCAWADRRCKLVRVFSRDKLRDRNRGEVGVSELVGSCEKAAAHRFSDAVQRNWRLAAVLAQIKMLENVKHLAEHDPAR